MRNLTSVSTTLLLCSLASIAGAAEPPQAPNTSTAAGTVSAAPAPSAPAPQTAAASAATSTADGAAAKPVAATEPPKVVCRTEKVTGSKLRTRKVCSSPDSADKSGDWVREQQARGGIGASAILNGN